MRIPKKICLVLLMVLLGWSGSCKEGVPERRYRAVSGTATAIDVNTGQVSMLWARSPGHEEQVSGHVTRDTEILINGISAGLQDIREGDRGIATVYSDDQRNWFVTRVEIERPEGFILDKGLPVGSAAGGP